MPDPLLSGNSTSAQWVQSFSDPLRPVEVQGHPSSHALESRCGCSAQPRQLEVGLPSMHGFALLSSSRGGMYFLMWLSYLARAGVAFPPTTWSQIHYSKWIPPPEPELNCRALLLLVLHSPACPLSPLPTSDQEGLQWGCGREPSRELRKNIIGHLRETYEGLDGQEKQDQNC